MITRKRGYREEYLGREAVFLIPMHKLENKILAGNKMFIEIIREFLKENYSDSWREIPDTKGFWRGTSDGLYMEFKISFVGKKKIPNFKKFLAELAGNMGEQCIYMGTGEDFWAIYPPVNSKPAC